MLMDKGYISLEHASKPEFSVRNNNISNRVNSFFHKNFVLPNNHFLFKNKFIIFSVSYVYISIGFVQFFTTISP